MIPEMLPSREAIERELLKRELEASLLEYTRWKFEVVKKTPFLMNWHHELLTNELEMVFNGLTQFLLITLPPRYTKTEIVVKSFMEWCFAKVPKSKFLHLSYSDDLALDNSAEVKETITSEEYQELWARELKADSKSKKKWYTKERGGVYATSTGGQITGFGAGGVSDDFEGAIIIDDPLKPEDARSDTVRNHINNRFNNTIKSRMNNPKKTPIIVIMQRLHEEDMAGWLLDGGSEFNFRHINLPAINEDGPNEYDPRQIGEPLWEAKHSAEQLELMKLKARETYAQQYQQRPMPAEGTILKKDWILYHNDDYPRNKRTIKTMSIDATFKGKSKGPGKNTVDYVVIQMWARNGSSHYLIDQTREQMSFTETIHAIKRMLERHPDCIEVLIEDKANGSAIIDTLSGKVMGVIPITPEESKEARFQSVASVWEAGNVFLPKSASWVDNFIREIMFFPNAKYDDQVDAMTQYLNRHATNASAFLENILKM